MSDNRTVPEMIQALKADKHYYKALYGWSQARHRIKTEITNLNHYIDRLLLELSSTDDEGRRNQIGFEINIKVAELLKIIKELEELKQPTGE